MRRREWLTRTSVFGLAAIPMWRELSAAGRSTALAGIPEGGPLAPPAAGSIPVAMLVSEGAVVIDFCGPWEVFQDVTVPGRSGQAFELFTVAESATPFRASGGLRILPDYTFDNAPQPKIIVIPAQDGHSEKTLGWIRRASRAADVTMSVCTGAFLLARTGLLAGKSVTTHHSGYKGLEMEFPAVHVKRGARFVDEGSVASAGGLSSGIDLALHLVERYFGRTVAEQTAFMMEYQGQGWLNPDSNQLYATVSTNPICPVCEMEIDPALAPKSLYKGKTYYFCSSDHKQVFEGAPDKFVKASDPK